MRPQFSDDVRSADYDRVVEERENYKRLYEELLQHSGMRERHAKQTRDELESYKRMYSEMLDMKNALQMDAAEQRGISKALADDLEKHINEHLRRKRYPRGKVEIAEGFAIRVVMALRGAKG